VRTAVFAAPFKAFDVLRRYPVIPGVIIVLLVLTAIFAPWLAPHDPVKADVLSRHTPPFWLEGGSTRHLLGTDALGRDVLSRIIGGARITVMVVVASVSTGVVVGTALGLITGYFGGMIDDILMRVIDAWVILPQLLIILIIVLTFGQGLSILIGVLAMLSWTGAVRLVRAETLSLRTRDYVALARVAGASDLHIIVRHLLPGVMNIVIVTATLGTGTIILAEASLSFLGAGIPPPEPSWGRMVGDERQYVGAAWWTSFFPGLAIALVVMSGNFLGDWMRDRFDPTLRQL
jgi:peptide/nickel transport system permease protein